MNLGSQDITTIKNIKEIFHDIQLRHPQLHTFGWGKDADIGASEVIYPLLWTSPTSATLIRSEQNGRYTSLEITINVKVLDSIKSGNQNEVDIESSTFQALSDIVNEFTEHPFYKYKSMSTVGNLFFNNLKEYSDDNSYGWEGDVTIRIRNNTSWCGIPATPLTGYDNVIPHTFSATTIPADFLTCDSLEDCPVIEEIQDDITNLETIVFRTNELISGGAAFLSGLTYDVTPLEYLINGQFYTTSSATQVTANSGDTNFDRIDLIIVDVNGNISILEGTPSANPVQPDVDETTQVVVAIITVPAGATAIPVQETLVYNEDVGVPTEWDGATYNDGGGTIDLAYSGITYSGTKSLRFNVSPNTAYAQFDSGTNFDTSTQNTIQFWVYNTVVWTSTQRLSIRLRNASNATVGSVVQLYNNRYGFSTTASSLGVWQLVSIPISDFNLTSPIIGKIDFQSWVQSGVGLSTIIDVVKFIEGSSTASQANKWWFVRGNTATTIIPTTTNSTLRLAGGSNINTYASGTNYIKFDLNTSLTGLTTVNATTFSGGTYYGDGSNLTGMTIPTGYWTASTGTGSIVSVDQNHTASGINSLIGGGEYNVADGYNSAVIAGGGFFKGLSLGNTATTEAESSVIAGGTENLIDSSNSFIAAGYKNVINASSSASAIIGGVQNTINNLSSFIGGGNNNNANDRGTGIIGGGNNTVNGRNSVIAGGINNLISEGYSFIGGGYGNIASASNSGIIGGSYNTVSGSSSTIIGGGNNTVSGERSIVGGNGNTASAYFAASIGGSYNTVSGDNSFIGGGQNNLASGGGSFIGGGLVNQVTGGFSFIGGGYGNIASASNSGIIGGSYNTVSGDNGGSFIGGGFVNQVTGGNSFIGGGDYNTITGHTSFIGGGNQNKVFGSYSSLIGGTNNLASGNHSSIVGGQSNTVSGTRSIILGGQNITGTNDDTVFVPYLNIGSISATTTATTYSDIVIDSNGNVMTNNIFYIGVNFTVTGVTWNYIAPESFLIYSVDNPSSITYDLLHNGTAYTFNNTINLYDTLEITGVTSTGLLKLNGETI